MAPDDLPPLSPDIERLLSAERAAPGPSPEMMSRITTRLDSSLAVSASAGASATTTATSMKAAASAVGGLSAIQWVTAAFVSAGLVTAVWVASTPSPDDVTPAPPSVQGPSASARPGPSAAPTSAPAVTAAPTTSGPVASPSAPPAAPAVAAAVAIAIPAELGASRAFERLSIETATVAVLETKVRLNKRPSQPADLEGERKLLSEARTALRSGRPTATLALLAEHRSAHPRGALVEEREALRILALAARGDRGAATKAAERFRARFKKSVHDGAIRAALGE